jgi:serine phosphatase RsbU (regulator of sigma subunit)
MMMMARASLLGALEASPHSGLSEIYRALNRSVHGSLQRLGVHMYMTFALLEHAGGGAFRAVGCHLPLLVYRRRTDTVEELELTGTWLGVVDELAADDVPELTFVLEPGDVLVLYTDGIVEHASAHELFGHDRLHRLIQAEVHAGPAALVDAIFGELNRFAEVRADDMTVLVIEHTGETARAASGGIAAA